MAIADQITVKRQDVAQIVRATFPNYKGRKFRIEPASSVTLYDLNWSGGTRNQYRTCTLAGESLGGADKYNTQAPWANQAEGKDVPVPPGAVVVQHADFCGKDLGLRIYVNPVDMPTLLPAPR